jgi:hypothetical protein
MGDLRDKVKRIECESWPKLLSEFEQLSYAKISEGTDHWIYRGQAKAEWWLKPSIELFRESLNAPRILYSIRQLEEQLLYNFQSLAKQFLVSTPDQNEILEWLAVLQHYGTPTRLLDWTYSPTVATYFALRDRPEDVFESSENDLCFACVWALNLDKLWKHLTDELKIEDRGKAYTRALKSILEDKEPSLVTPFLPRGVHSRLSAQQGLFLVKTADDRPFMQTLDGLCTLDDGTFIRRLVIPYRQRVSMLAHLLEHNIHEVGLFPGADGLGRFVRTKVEVQFQTLGLR